MPSSQQPCWSLLPMSNNGNNSLLHIRKKQSVSTSG
ncbi:unnamed protein product [Staurois parvus]|uniref:Uncharacterized protein n=1 Tax=Staurois parvus TaxID=386267 RepID=A0ABN9BDW7_9NEOB|nr:unnamed protein product [Staurois parvus]